MSAQKPLEGSKTKTRELLEERKRVLFPRQGVIDLPPRQIIDFLQKRKQKKIELVSRPDGVERIEAWVGIVGAWEVEYRRRTTTFWR